MALAAVSFAAPPVRGGCPCFAWPAPPFPWRKPEMGPPSPGALRTLWVLMLRQSYCRGTLTSTLLLLLDADVVAREEGRRHALEPGARDHRVDPRLEVVGAGRREVVLEEEDVV